MKKLLIILMSIFVGNTVAYTQFCFPYVTDTIEFKVEPKYAKVEAEWYPSWVEYMNGKEEYPASLPPLEKWEHPYMKFDLSSAMHEDCFSSDVSNSQGPVPINAEVQYFHVLEKGKQYSGMCPSFAFVDENTMVTLSFGRATTTLLLLDIKDSIKVLDAMTIPGRGHKGTELISNKARMKLFRSTEGGAYFFLSKKNEVFIPGPQYNILYIPVVDRKFDRSMATSLDILEIIKQADLVHEGLTEKEGWNKLTALMPDAEGNIWFTSRLGMVGMVDLNDTVGLNCPKVYASFILGIGLLKKIDFFFGKKYDDYKDLEFYREGMSATEYRNELRKFFMVDPHSREEIQNSFTVGPDGVYVISNIALYKLKFDRENKEIILDPKWEKAFDRGDLIYYNDWIMKMGQLNNGSGTTPTLMDDRFVVYADNDYHQINMCVHSQEDGSLISRHRLFNRDASACENSIVAYKNSLIIGNTFNFIDPFKENPTPGGLMRFDYDESTGRFEERRDWPAEFIDPKSATPKMTTVNGLIYVYHRSDSTFNKHHDWQLTAIDFVTGRKVFFIRPYFEKGGFNDNTGLLIKTFSLGRKNYNKKVFNNIWATYAFGPNNSIYIGAFRGFLKFSSDPLD